MSRNVMKAPTRRSARSSTIAATNAVESGFVEASSNLISTKPIVYDELEAIQHDTTVYSLTGPFGALPVETLLDIITQLDPKSVVLFLATCKALRQLSQGNNSTYLYRGLYHALISGIPAHEYSLNHTVWSPTLPQPGQTQITLSVTEPIPIEGAVTSWRDQYFGAVFWYFQEIYPETSSASTFRCSLCREKDCVISALPTMKLRVCLECYARNLVHSSHAALYGLTTHDIRLLPIADGLISTFDLLTLAKCKQPSFSSPAAELKPIDHKPDRLALVECAVFLVAGVNWDDRLPKLKVGGGEGDEVEEDEEEEEEEESEDDDEDNSKSKPRRKVESKEVAKGVADDEIVLRKEVAKGVADDEIVLRNFKKEFNAYVNDKLPSKPSKTRATRIAEYNVYAQTGSFTKSKGKGKAAVVRTKTPIVELLDDYSDSIYKYAHLFPTARDGSPFFVIRDDLMDTFPSNESLAAWKELKRRLQEENLSITSPTQSSTRFRPITERTITIVQDYLIDPSVGDIEHVLDCIFLDNEATGPKRRIHNQVTPTPAVNEPGLLRSGPTLPQIFELVESPGAPPHDDYYNSNSWRYVRSPSPAVHVEMTKGETIASPAYLERVKSAKNVARIEARRVKQEKKRKEDEEWRAKQIKLLKLTDAQRNVIRAIRLVKTISGEAMNDHYWRAEGKIEPRFRAGNKFGRRLIAGVQHATAESRVNLVEAYVQCVVVVDEVQQRRRFRYNYGRTTSITDIIPNLSKLYHRGNVATSKRLAERRNKNSIDHVLQDIDRLLLQTSQIIPESKRNFIRAQIRCPRRLSTNATICTDGYCWVPHLAQSQLNAATRYRY